MGWTLAAQKWLSGTFGRVIPNRMLVTTTILSEKRVQVDKTYQTVLSAQRLLAWMQGASAIDDHLLKRLKRKLRELDIEFTGLDEVQGQLDGFVTVYFDKLQKKALASWREKVKTWHSTTSHLYRYLRNKEPAKAVVMRTPKGVTSAPLELWQAFHDYWGNLEKLPCAYAEQHMLDELEDRFSFFLPYQPVSMDLRAIHCRNK